MGCGSSAEDGDLFSSNEHNSKNKKIVNSNNNSNKALHYDSSKTPDNKTPNKKINSVNNVINIEDEEDRFESSKSSIDEQEELKYENKNDNDKKKSEVLEISKNSSELSSHSEEKAH